MGTLIITFRSVTPAQRADRVFRNAGIPCHLGRTPRWMEEQGCGYNLRIRYLELEDVMDLLKNHKISYRKVYIVGANGAMEELAR